MSTAAAVGQTWRGIGLLTASLIALSVMASLTVLILPEDRMAVDHVRCQQRTESGRALDRERVDRLPYQASAVATGEDVLTVCDFEIELSENNSDNLALYVPSFTDEIMIDVDRQRVASTELYAMRTLRWVSLPAFVPLDRDTIHPGVNKFRITLAARQNRAVSLDRIYIGPRETLRPFYQGRWVTSALLPTLVVGGQLALALVFALIWAARRSESVYGWLAVMLALGAIHGSVLIPDFGIGDSDFPIWNLMSLWEATAAVLFMLAVTGDISKKSARSLAIAPAIIWLLALFASPAMMRGTVRLAGSAVVLSYFLIGTWVLARASLRGNRDAVVTLLGVAFMFAFTIHDALIILEISSGRVFLARAAFSGFVITVCTLMTLRFVRAMSEVDRTAEELRLRVEAAEEELRITYEELRARRENEAVERERSRLMRDLHDGLGGELASMLALADSPRPRGAEIASHARAALADMRLIISSLEDYGGDLTLALASWHERVWPQVRDAGLVLEWRVRDLPPMPGLGPAQVLDVLRIVQEAVTNVIKHAQATQIIVAAQASDDLIKIAVSDNGVGRSEEGGGNGCRNMAMRSKNLGADLEIAHRECGTAVVLTIPLTLYSEENRSS